MAKSSTSFTRGNQVAKKNPKVVIRKFKEMLSLSETDDNILCFQDACKAIKWRQSKVEYWVKKLPVFETLKKDIQSNIISRVNKGALTGGFNPTASIWRQKQLGETDTTNIDHTTKGNEINQSPTFVFKNLNETE